jgi:lipoate---protein ligase
VTSAPPPLLDVEAVRKLTHPTLGAMEPASSTVVLGSTQRTTDLDDRALVRDGVTVRRRRGGGGAVLLRPGDCWVELWLPATSDAERGDVRSTAYRVGGWWQAAISVMGATTDVHQGGLRDADQGAVACFAGLGPGELTAGGRKLVGISQWRAHEGALVSSVIIERSPGDLSAYLSDDSVPVPQLGSATGLVEALPHVTAPQLADAFRRVVAASLPTLRLEGTSFP